MLVEALERSVEAWGLGAEWSALVAAARVTARVLDEGGYDERVAREFRFLLVTLGEAAGGSDDGWQKVIDRFASLEHSPES